MDEMRYQLNHAKAILTSLTHRLINYIGDDESYKDKLRTQISDYKSRIAKIERAMSLYEEAMNMEV